MDTTQMIDLDEKRLDARYDCEAIIKWSYFNKETYFDAKILNFSRSGIYIQTAHDIKPGTTIFIKLEILLSNNVNSLNHECLHTVSLGEVRWCIDLSGSDKSCYGVGLRYLFPD
jgi:hypothetical protein